MLWKVLLHRLPQVEQACINTASKEAKHNRLCIVTPEASSSVLFAAAASCKIPDTNMFAQACGHLTEHQSKTSLSMQPNIAVEKYGCNKTKDQMCTSWQKLCLENYLSRFSPPKQNEPTKQAADPSRLSSTPSASRDDLQRLVR